METTPPGRRTRLKALTVVLAMVGATAALAVVAGTPAMAATPAAHVTPNGCAVETDWETVQVGGRYYHANGPTAGKYNSSSSSSTLTYSETTTNTQTTTFSASTSLSIGWAIATVKLDLGVSVATSVAKGRTVTDNMTVDSHHYGRITPKVEFTNYEFEEYRLNGNCTATLIQTSPEFRAITASKYFAECQDTTNTCTPKP